MALIPIATCASSQLRRGLGRPMVMSRKANSGAN